MKTVIGILLFLTFPILAKGQKEYRMVWSDEFEVDGRPSKDWTFERGFKRNQELQWYQSQNAWVKDGCLVIEGRKEHHKNPLYEAGSSDWRRNREFIEYTSSSLTTRLGF